MNKISPSMLSADFACLGSELEEIYAGGADALHYDVMDGIFVPNISFGIPVLKSLRRATALPIDAHLMITQPVRYVEEFCRAGADLVNIHVESDTEEALHEAIRRIHACGKKAGVTLKPDTSAEAVLPFLGEVELVLVMTVYPGFGGQSFMASQMDTVRRVREMIDRIHPGVELQVDGGIALDTIAAAAAAGADNFVAGSSVFGKPDRAEAIRSLRAAAALSSASQG